jgi:cyclopropane fatty-acyl-phospholipid synthase-like methyltransferase
MKVDVKELPMSGVSGREAVCDAYRRDDLADDYIRSRYESSSFGNATHRCQVRTLRRVLTRLGVKRLLEVAPGPARLTVHLPRVEFGCAVEQSPAMIRNAEERLEKYGRDDWQVEQGDAFDLRFQSGEFDAALAFKLIRHFEREERRRLVDSMRGAVKSSGNLVFDVANENAYKWLHAKWGVEKGWIDDFWFTRKSIRDEMREFGFDRVELHPVQPAISAQYYCWTYLTKVSRGAANVFGAVLDRLPVGEPLEWIAVCRCE